MVNPLNCLAQLSARAYNTWKLFEGARELVAVGTKVERRRPLKDLPVRKTETKRNPGAYLLQAAEEGIPGSTGDRIGLYA